MVGTRQDGSDAPVPVDWAPPGHRELPVEVLDLSSVLERTSPRGMGRGQRVGFHLLMCCVGGSGTHIVDFEPLAMTEGTCVRVHPGQVQRFVTEPAFDAVLVVWPDRFHPADPSAPAWFPGCGAATRWELSLEAFARVLGTINEIRSEQAAFRGSPRHSALLQSLLRTLVLRTSIEAPESVPDADRLPAPYLEFRRQVEQRLHQRPTVKELADDLGYSSRTLDRACQQVLGQTAKQVLDDRLSLELRRLLTHTDRPLTSIARDFSFDDPSNFTKFVKRHLGELPTDIRDHG